MTSKMRILRWGHDVRSQAMLARVAQTRMLVGRSIHASAASGRDLWRLQVASVAVVIKLEV